MEKLIYLLGETESGNVPRGRSDLRERLFSAASDLAAEGARDITFCVADVEDPDLAEIVQFNAMGMLDAQISLWVDSIDDRAGIEAIVAELTPRHAGYLVTESILRDYPESSWDRRSWKPGEASPGISIFTSFPKPDRLDLETFYARWHGSHGPLTLELHPLTRYVRNAVFRPLTKDAPTLHAIVSESVESCAVAADVEQFYSGKENRKRIVKDVLSFAEIETMSSVVMREYILEV